MESEEQSPYNSGLQLTKEYHRLWTLREWKSITPSARALALVGFYYAGSSDIVKCYFCNIQIGVWQPLDRPLDEHLRWSPTCPLVTGQETLNEPICIDQWRRLLPANTTLTLVNQINPSNPPPIPPRRSTLLRQVSSLSDHPKYVIKKDDTKESHKLCVICYENDYNSVFLACGHVIACIECAEKVNECPFCRTRCTGVMKIYLP